MDSIVSIFHLDLKLLIAQAINFLIIFFILYRFAFKPISNIMQERTATIEKSLDDAKKIEERLLSTEKEREDILLQAQKDSAELINKAQKTAEENSQKLIEKTKEDLAKMSEKEKDNIQMEKKIALKELRQELSDLIVLASEKIIKEKVDSDKDKKIIEEIIK